jgi:predicted MFS family arabinose efflux permease
VNDPKGAPPALTRPAALRFVIAFGVVSLFADMTYEGMRSIAGPYLALLGASSAVVGLVAGAGELLGYTLRLASGSLADRARLYWPITLAGYLVQMAAVPALALTGSWPAAAALIILERIGKATRNPPRDVMLSRAGDVIGQGWAFGLHEALDQSGALLGPLLAALVLALRHEYRAAFGWLLAPALLTLLLVLSVRLRYPAAGRIRAPAAAGYAAADRLPRTFWWYTAGAAMVGFGFADYALVSYHFAVSGSVRATAVPVFYAIAMAAAGAGSLAAGRAYDRVGLIVLLPCTLLVIPYAPLVFLGGFGPALGGTVLWGLGLGIHEAVMSAAVAQLAPLHRRARAYGLFTAIFGISWFAGSALLGALYAWSAAAVAALAASMQLLALIPLGLAVRASRIGQRPVASRRNL